MFVSYKGTGTEALSAVRGVVHIRAVLREFLESRKFTRHTVRVPIQVTTANAAPGAERECVDVSQGGLAFLVDEVYSKDRVVWVRMPTVTPPFAAQARVAWCRPEGTRYRIGVQFLDAQATLQALMVEQVCAIEEYRIKEMKRGRRLSTADAAAEWARKQGITLPAN